MNLYHIFLFLFCTSALHTVCAFYSPIDLTSIQRSQPTTFNIKSNYNDVLTLHSTLSEEDISPTVTKPTWKRKPIPGWGKAINEKLGMPMITKADKYHLHAFSAVIWFTGAYGLLLPAWVNEFQHDNWGIFSHIAPYHWALLFSGTVMCATAQTMLPARKSLKNYSRQMRSAMSSCAALIMMAAAFMVQGDTLPVECVLLTKVLASTSYIYMIWGAATEGRPWHILPIMNEMKLNNDNSFVVVPAYGLGILWYSMAALCVAHGVLGGSESITDFEGPLASSFAAQMALCLAITPANDALTAGTMMKNEVFLKPNKKRITLVDDPKKGLRVAYWVEAGQIIFDYGPAAATMGAAIFYGHSELVYDFFYVDAFKEIVSHTFLV